MLMPLAQGTEVMVALQSGETPAMHANGLFRMTKSVETRFDVPCTVICGFPSAI
jgi:hypothetical protein